jgi:ATP-binding cassette subfamily B (MDR/TAP) protein 1
MDSSDTQSPSWKHLLSFTTRRHLQCAIPAVFFSTIAGLALPVNSYLIGKIFGAFSKYGTGELNATEFKHEVSRLNVYTVILGSGSWLCNSLGITLWLIFGDLQARSARTRLFDSMIDRDIAWFDKRQDGADALVSRLLT